MPDSPTDIHKKRIRLLELGAELLSAPNQDHSFRRGSDFSTAAGVLFLCPVYYLKNSRSKTGVHSVICWTPEVSQEHSPKPGRWHIRGSSINDLTLEGTTSDSVVLLNKKERTLGDWVVNGCGAHFFVRNGLVEIV